MMIFAVVEEGRKGEQMSLIERQAAIDAIHCDITVTGKQNAELVASTIGVFVDRIKALPSAQPERKTGTWIPYDTIPRYVICRCSACGTDILVPCINDKTIFNYCPNCGAKMEKKQYE